MTTEEWRKLPTWVKLALIDTGYSAGQIGHVRYQLEGRPRPVIEVLLRPTLPKEIDVKIVVDQGGR